MNEIEICIITMRINIILRRINIHLIFIISHYFVVRVKARNRRCNARELWASYLTQS